MSFRRWISLDTSRFSIEILIKKHCFRFYHPLNRGVRRLATQRTHQREEAKARAQMREAANNSKAWSDATKEAKEDAEKKRAESDRLDPAPEE